MANGKKGSTIGLIRFFAAFQAKGEVVFNGILKGLAQFGNRLTLKGDNIADICHFTVK